MNDIIEWAIVGTPIVIGLISPIIWILYFIKIDLYKKSPEWLKGITFLAAFIGFGCFWGFLAGIVIGSVAFVPVTVIAIFLFLVFQVAVMTKGKYSDETLKEMSEYYQSEEFKKTKVDFITKERNEIINEEIKCENSVDWSPLNKGGNTSKTRMLKKEEHVLQYTPTSQAYTKFLPVVIGGIFFLYLGIRDLLQSVYDPENVGYMIVGGCGLIALSLYLIYKESRPIVFDLKLKELRIGRGNQREDVQSTFFTRISFPKISAIQLVDEFVTSEKTSNYTSYEMNLLLTDGSRVHLIDYMGRDAILQDADTISQKLDIPIFKKWEIDERLDTQMER